MCYKEEPCVIYSVLKTLYCDFVTATQLSIVWRNASNHVLPYRVPFKPDLETDFVAHWTYLAKGLSYLTVQNNFESTISQVLIAIYIGLICSVFFFGGGEVGGMH